MRGSRQTYFALSYEADLFKPKFIPAKLKIHRILTGRYFRVPYYLPSKPESFGPTPDAAEPWPGPQYVLGKLVNIPSAHINDC